MKRLLIAVAAFSAMAAAAAAQPAYDPSQGAAPSDYPRCSHRGQDRCSNHGWSHHKGSMKMMKHMHHRKGGKSHHSTTDGERG